MKNQAEKVYYPSEAWLDQSRLNVSTRSRTSRLPWRGQFSPELVEYFMQALCADAEVFFDPFAGSGTVLYEAIRHGKTAYGLEVNPAAWHLAVLASLGSLRARELDSVKMEVAKLQNDAALAGSRFENAKSSKVAYQFDDATPRAANLVVAASILLGMGNQQSATVEQLVRGAATVLGIIDEVRGYGNHAACHLRDARSNRLPSEFVDAVITSPPYINVFNYHQNYRPACELIGWKPLEAARSEIGSNRANRMNRFLTVVQYCIDMQDCLTETARVMRPGAPLVIVLGRTSNVLGAAFKNGEIVRALIENSGCFDRIQQEGRVFVSRFGDHVFEDILIAKRARAMRSFRADPRTIALNALQGALNSVSARNQPALEGAIKRGISVQGSPLLNLTVPSFFNEE